MKKTVSISTVRRIRYKQPANYCIADSTRTRRRRVKFPELEQQLVAFFMNMKKKPSFQTTYYFSRLTLSITDDQLLLSNDWLAKFKKRNGISSTRLHGEADSSPAVEVRSSRCKTLPATTDPRISTTLMKQLCFIDWLRTKRLLQRDARKKHDKARITIAFCCNATRTHKLNPLVIGTAANPRCFRGGACLALKWKPVEYYNSSKAWMTSTIFFEWFQSFNLNMAVENRKVLLLVDNASSHKVEQYGHSRLDIVDDLFTGASTHLKATSSEN
ncbi:hypothetical protein PHMEG_00039382 [Phytophthora megakarya]|uniref:HTH CENPB-type domain-containing protein n=1 Tax=Phytophthora megakarya TaxID=4795 RepID=A0A225UFZ4_9STRA|nr:hypothetical protein PHMEG_00039382 [Phytophthora megakarya]